MSATTSFLLLLMLLLGRAASQLSPLNNRYSWFSHIRYLLQDCHNPRQFGQRQQQQQRQQRLVDTLTSCARRRALAAIDYILEDDIVPIIDGIDLVKYNNQTYLETTRPPINNTLTLNIRDLLKRIRERDRVVHLDGGGGGGEGEEGSWPTKLIKRLARVLKTHVIKIDMERLRSSSVTTAAKSSTADQVESRGRRRRRRQMQMMPIIMMGVLLMGSVLIPMGFQFLAVLGGKALILAKMALMLSSIQGLKKIATNGVNYGLYHSPVAEPWHERSTAGIELPSYSLGYTSGYTGGHAQVASSQYLDPASLGYLQTNRRSANVLQSDT